MPTPPPSPSPSFSPPLPTPLTAEEDDDLNECLNHLFSEDYVTGSISDIDINELLCDTSMELDIPSEASSPPKQIKSVSQVQKSGKKIKHRRSPALKSNKKSKSSSKVKSSSKAKSSFKKKSKIPFVPTLQPVPERNPLSPVVSETELNSSESDSEPPARIILPPVTQVVTLSETEEPNSSESDSEPATRITLSPVTQVVTLPDPLANTDLDTVQDMILATPPSTSQAITLPESDSAQSSPELYISTDTEFDSIFTPKPVTLGSDDNIVSEKPVTQVSPTDTSSKVEVFPADDIRVKQREGIELTRKPPRTYSRKDKDARETITRKRNAPLPHEDARHLLEKIRPLKEDARKKIAKPPAQVGYYTSNYRIPKTSKSASNSSNSNQTSVKQNEPAVQEDSNSVKQNKTNSADDDKDNESELSSNIEKGATFLKKKSYPAFKPRQLKYKPSEADLKAKAEVENRWKDKTIYNSNRDVHPNLFSNLDNIPSYTHQVPKVRVPRAPLPSLRDRHTSTEHRFIIVGHILAEHLANNFKTGLQAAAFRYKEKFVAPILYSSRPCITDVALKIHDHLETEGIWRVIFTDVSTFGVGNNKQKPALIKICNIVNEQCKARHKHLHRQRCRVLVSAIPPPIDVYTPPHLPLGQNHNLSHLEGMTTSVIREMRHTWWTTHVSYNKNCRRLGANGAADLVELTDAVPLSRLLHHYEFTSQWPHRQAEARFTPVTLNEMARMVIGVLNN